MNPILGVALLSLAAGAMISALPQDDKTVPVHQEPRHHVVFDSPGTRILDIQIPPGDTTLFHTHVDPILYVTLSTSQMRNQSFGGEWSGTAPTTPSSATSAPAFRVAPTNPAGRMMSTTSYAEKPLTHRVNNIGSTLYRLIGITNTSPGDITTTSSTDFAAKPEADNRWFRGYRWALTQEPSDEHRHANPVAIVVVNGGAVAAVGATKTSLDKPGGFVFVEANLAHRVHGTSGDAEAVEVEVRRPR